MANGGKIVLRNKTPYIWMLTYKHCSLVNSWEFTEKVDKYSISEVVIDWDEESNCEVVEVPDRDVGNYLGMWCQDTNSPDYEIDIDEIISILSKRQGSSLSLSWEPYGYIHFHVRNADTDDTEEERQEIIIDIEPVYNKSAINFQIDNCNRVLEELSKRNKRILNFDFCDTEENVEENFICNFNTFSDSKEIMSEEEELRNKIMRNFYFF